MHDVDCTKIVIAENKLECPSRRPLGLSVETSARKSVVGERELKRILRATNKDSRQIRRSGYRSRLRDESFSSLGQISLHLATTRGLKPIFIDFYVGQGDIRALLDMEVLEREQLSPILFFTDFLDDQRTNCMAQDTLLSTSDLSL